MVSRRSELFDVARAAEAHVGMRKPRILGVDVRAPRGLLRRHERAALQDPELGRRSAALRGRPGRRPLPDVAAHTVYAEGAFAVVEVLLIDRRGAGGEVLVHLPVLEAVAGIPVLLLQEDV